MSTFLALFTFFTNYFGRNATVKVLSYSTEDHIIKTIDDYVVESRVKTITIKTTTNAYQVKTLHMRSKGNHFLEGDEYAHLTDAQRRALNRNIFEWTCCGSLFWREATQAEADAAGKQMVITKQVKVTHEVTLDVSHLHIVESEREATTHEVAMYVKAKAEHARFYRANGYMAL